VIPNQLPDGIKVSSLTFKPSTVEVRGAYSRIQTIDAVPTEPIFLSPNALRQEFDVKLSLTDFPGVSVDEASKVVHVTVDLVGSVSRKWFRGLSIGVKLGSGNSAQTIDPIQRGLRIRPGQVNFLLEGPDSVMNALTEKEIEVWAEVPSLKSGSQRARLDWRLPPDVRVVRRTADYADVVAP
jgi:YbbR domain-containing protein